MAEQHEFDNADAQGEAPERIELIGRIDDAAPGDAPQPPDLSKWALERRSAREGALALLYSSDIAETDLEQVIEAGEYPADDVALTEYAEQLVYGVMEHRAQIDARLQSSSENWSLERMPVVDRALLRIAVYEMLFQPDVPVSVAINEAVELAKFYGGEDDSARFVNGVLGRIARSEGSEGLADAEAGAVSEDADGVLADSVEDEPSGEVESDAQPE